MDTSYNEDVHFTCIIVVVNTGFFNFVCLMEKVRKNNFLIILLLIVITIGACSPERKLLKQFVSLEKPRSALLIAPEFVYKENMKKDILDSLNVTDERLFDSVLMSNSVVLKDIQDSTFIVNYMLGLESELQKFGFYVYREDATNAFMEQDSNAYIVNVAQVEIEEAYFPVRDETVMYSTYYYHDHILNSIYISSWFEVNGINTVNAEHDVYFATDVITDDLDGEFLFDYFSSEVKYLYEIDSLDRADVYEFAYLLGRTYAGYAFDLLLNSYLHNNLPEVKRSGKYWRYNPVTGSFFYATDDKFVPMKE